MILAPGREYFSAKCALFPFKGYEIKLNEVHFSSEIIHLRNKPYQELNFECHLNSVLLCK